MQEEDFKRQLLKRAAWLSTVLFVIAAVLGKTSFALGIVSGFILAFFNFLFMSRAVEKALKLSVRGAKFYLWLNTSARYLAIAFFLIFVFRRQVPLGVGVSVGLLSIVLAAVTSLLVPFKPLPKEGA